MSAFIHLHSVGGRLNAQFISQFRISTLNLKKFYNMLESKNAYQQALKLKCQDCFDVEGSSENENVKLIKVFRVRGRTMETWAL